MKRKFPGLAVPNFSPKKKRLLSRNENDLVASDFGINFEVSRKSLKSNQVPEFTEAEKWENQKMFNSGIIPRSKIKFRDNDFEEQVQIEVNESEPRFLKGQTKLSKKIEEIQVQKDPDGCLAKAAANQADIILKRRKLKREKENANQKSGNQITLRSKNDTSLKNAPPLMRNNSSTSKVTEEQRRSLPIFKLKSELLEAFEKNQLLVVIGETGSGKTTQMAQYLCDLGYHKHGIIGCTQPRRVAAISVAKRVAEEVGCRLGSFVGFTIRFEDCTNSQTRVKYMTDGMLMREYLADPRLSKYSVLILDEAHERTVHTDILFALLKELLKTRDDLKLIITSATLDADQFSKYFNNCPIFRIPGRTFPVEILYTKDPEEDYVDAALVTTLQIHLSEPAGDILVFLTGQEEIETAAEILQHRLEQLGKDVPELLILPAYGALPSEMQSRIFLPAPAGSRKVILATNIAEASLTIDGVFFVVDPGFVKQNVYNAKLGMDTLQPVPISQASARQRSGRAGRTGPGRCYRLYTEKSFQEEMLPTTVPEIQRTNLGNVVLQLKAMGINDLVSFDFMSPPPSETLVAALEKLFALGALDEDGYLTKLGKKMSEFPLEPVLSKMLLTSVFLNCAAEAVTVVSMLTIESPFYRPRSKQEEADKKRARFTKSEGDHITLLNVYESWQRSNFSRPWCFDNFIQYRAMQKAIEIRKQLMRILDRLKLRVNSCSSKYILVQKAITAGFFTHAAKRSKGQGYKTLAQDQEVFIHPSSALFHRPPQYVLYHELIMTSKEYMRNVMYLDQKWLLELAPNFFQKGKGNSISRRANDVETVTKDS